MLRSLHQLSRLSYLITCSARIRHFSSPPTDRVLSPGSCRPSPCSFYESRADELGLTRRTYSTLLRRQIEYLNSRILEAVDRIVAADPTGVIVLFSDHATRYDLEGDPEETNHNLFAARTPGRVGVFADDQTPVNIFPRLLNAYLSSDIPLTPYRAWVSEGDPLMLVPLQ